MRIIEEEKKPLFFEEEKLTPTESKYRSAVKLQEAVECVERFEHAVSSLESAQKLFEEMGEYKDSAKRAEQCAALAETMHTDGLEQAYQDAVKMMEEARDKLAFRTVISEFMRFPEYKDSAERIEECKRKLKRIATRQVWKNRVIAVGVLAAAAGIFWISPAKPYTRGMVHLHQGKYRQALADFDRSGSFLDSRWQKKKCRYNQAQKAYKSGDIDRALGLCLLARGRGEADDFMAELSVERMKEAQPGETVYFGADKISSRERRREKNLPETGEDGQAAESDLPIKAGSLYMVPWVVAGRDGDVLTLVNIDSAYRGSYDRETNDWPQSRLRKWLNRKLKDQLFSGSEKRLLQPVVNGNPERPDKVYILGREDLNILDPLKLSSAASEGQGWPECWLRDAGEAQDRVCSADSGAFVRAVEDASLRVVGGREFGESALITEERDIYPVVRVSLDPSLIREETASASPVPTGK